MSKKFAILLLAIWTGVLLGAGCLNGAEQSPNPASAPILNVDNIVSDPSAYSGVIGIRGVVAFVSPSDSTFTS
jgi:hypothetical protein